MNSSQFLSRGIDYLGDLGAKLKDLQGFSTLAYELIQNADDAPGVTTVIFDVRDEALIVENDGRFSDCGRMDSPECPWRDDPGRKHRCDFHRFRHVAGGDKREQPGVTGAFGIGFIAVYQITDQPELISAGRHWLLHEDRPEDERIEVCQGCPGCGSHDLPATRFILPWATNPNSRLRKALRAEGISPDTPRQLLKDLNTALPTAMLFLKQIKRVELKNNGLLKRRFERLDKGHKLILTDGNARNDRVWHLVRGDFSQRAEEVKNEHPGRIEAKRSATVTLAVPDVEMQSGLLCAFLPTQHETGLPFHVNADFFPTSDRKRIIFESDYQSRWNRYAIEAAAEALRHASHTLPELLGHKRYWRFLESIRQIADEAKQGRRERLLTMFWEAIEPTLRGSEIVYATSGEWKKPEDAVFLLQREEMSSVRVLENLGFSVVHEDLRPYLNLLRSEAIGVPILTIDRLCAALESEGLTKRLDVADWPIWLQKKGALRTLWGEIGLLLSPQGRPKTTEGEKERLKALAIAPGRDRALWPCAQVYHADRRTVTLFKSVDPEIPFLADSAPDFEPISHLCLRFDAEAAIRRLSNINAERLRAAWRENRLDLKRVFGWFEDHRAEILENPALKAALVKLPIFPSSDELHPLSELALPGDFEDPLGLAALVDIPALGGRREFLRELGVQALDFRCYAAVHLPIALRERSLATGKRRQAVLLLANKLGEIKDDHGVQQALATAPLAECDDGEFREAHLVYFKNAAVIECLGESVSLAVVSEAHGAAVHDLYIWLGVSVKPRFEDLVERVKALTSRPPSVHNRQSIVKIFAHLGLRFKDEDNTIAIDELRTLPWLPASGRADRWYAAGEVYAVFQDYLFETQAFFLDVPRDVQNASTGLLQILQIKLAPTPAIVVRHLLHCAEIGRPVNQEVYRFLNDHAEDSALNGLKGKPCLLLGDGSYIEPSQVFWREHPFGRFRRRLGTELRRYSPLFERLEVRETPDHQDALHVLKEIADEFGSAKRCLDEEALAVLLASWRMLQDALSSGEITEDTFAELRDIPCVPNRKKLLNRPHWMFFEDRAGLASKFKGYLDQNLIARPLDAGTAMGAAGVRPLRRAVEVRLLECVDPVEAEDITICVRERRVELARVLETQVVGGSAAALLTRLQKLRFENVVELKVQYALRAFGRVLESDPESTLALFQPDAESLLFVRQNGQQPWAAIARELALALFPEDEPGRIAMAVKEVLAAETVHEARTLLDELGFATVDEDVRVAAGGTSIESLGGERSEAPGTSGDQPVEAQEALSPEEAIKRLLGPDAARPSPPPAEGSVEEESSRPAAARGSPKQPATRRGRLRSYVIERESDNKEGGNSEAVERRSEIEEAGVKRALAFEQQAGRRPKLMPPKHPGFDIESTDGDSTVKRYIEVKAVAGDWGSDGVRVTKTEFEKAREIGERYWLYVIERADQPDAKLHCIQNPARRVDEFLFDDGWRGAAEVERTE